ncbi:metal-dependent hydrolase family protein [Flammeovirga aprica]|uniref:Amidohydrolase family protein n=1 Tax=Flammeovirga aprica JL-4 TaxID=694437 RepID=A0A7X9RTY2_9BACT|nr:amidohydrolase family protein [Flammeovirga aprica]NME68057.1 amidohydrolase family protein [Flammeovirga aprica JL-4]
MKKLFILLWLFTSSQLFAQNDILIKNVDVFDGKNEKLQKGVDVLIHGNKVQKISKNIHADSVEVINGEGKTLIPGLIDAHWHTTYAYTPATVLLMNQGDMPEVAIRSMKGAEQTLMRGFTTVRDPGGNPFAIKKLIDSGEYPGHRILPSGPFMSQTTGHADHYCILDEPRKSVGDMSYWERNMMAITADGVPEVRKVTREILKYGATQIKICTGGGVSSEYDPLEVMEYSMDEIKAIVEEAENYGTYVQSHVMIDKGIIASVNAGVKSIEHGFFASDSTLQLMKDKGVWLSPQPFLENDNSFADPGSQEKWLQVVKAVDNVYQKASKIGVKVSFGTDILFDAENTKNQNVLLARLGNWYSPYEALRIATSGNAELLEMSGSRHPYQEGPLGVVEEGAYADMILVDGNPLENLDLVADPENNFLMIMKDGVIYKNTTK